MVLRINFLLGLCIALVISGCMTTAPEERWKPVSRHSSNQVHIVVWDDESLAAISSWYTGSNNNVDAILGANPTLNSELLRKDDKVFIPQNLVKTRGNMSRKFLDNFNTARNETVDVAQDNGPKTPRIIFPVALKKKVTRKTVASISTPIVEPSPTAKTEPSVEVEPEEEVPLFGPR